ncbi:MAG TPA: hypothetical protein VGX23_05115 [Actinocrinis sp.]|nr:hypothetical protein [Actinocrinis sp.]
MRQDTLSRGALTAIRTTMGFRMTSTQQRIHAACLARLRRLPMPEPFDLELLCRRISAQRGRPLSIQAWEPGLVPSSLTGSCLPYGDQDVIYHQPWATGLHRTQIVLHEIAHLVCGHVAHDAGRPKAAEAAGLFDMLGPEAYATMFARHDNYGDAQEREAETMASLMLEYALAHAPRAEDPLLSRLHAALVPNARSGEHG